MSNLKGISSQIKKPFILYSFPHKIGAGQICHTAWQQVDGVAKTGQSILLSTGAQIREFGPQVIVKKTLGLGKLRIPYRLLGRLNASKIHDLITARLLKKNKAKISAVHCWPLGSLQTIRAAKKLGIPSFLERPNAHTEFAYNVVEEECRIVGIELPDSHEHKRNDKSLKRELLEYHEADYLLCPSDFVAKTFKNKGFPENKLIRHRYGYDSNLFSSLEEKVEKRRGIRAIYVGACAPRKGLHYAVEAWHTSGAKEDGEFLVCGGFVPNYAEAIGEKLKHPSIKVLGHRQDIPELMRQSDVFILSSVEEGSALVTYEARASACVLVVSDATGAVVEHEKNGLVHKARDQQTLTEHLRRLRHDGNLLDHLRKTSLQSIDQLTWSAAGKHLASIYNTHSRSRP